MRLSKRIFVWSIFAVTCLGCATSNPNHRIAQGNYTNQVQEGVTTKAQVSAMFGAPTRVMTSTYGDTWYYTAKTQGQVSTGQQVAAALLYGTKPVDDTSMTVYFNQNGTVKSKSMSYQSYWGKY